MAQAATRSRPTRRTSAASACSATRIRKSSRRSSSTTRTSCATARPRPASNDWKIGTFYLACMDTAALEKAGFKPIKPTLDADRGGEDDRRRREAVRHGRRRGGAAVAAARRRRARAVLARTADRSEEQQDGHSLGEPGRSRRSIARTTSAPNDARGSTPRRLRRPRHALARADRRERARRPAADAKTILALETAIAKITIPQADMRDPGRDVSQDDARRVSARRRRTSTGRDISSSRARQYAGDVNVRAPSFFTALDSLHRGDAGGRLEGVPALARRRTARWARSARRSARKRSAGSRSRAACSSSRRACKQCARGDERRARRSRRSGLDQAQLLARGQGARGEDGRQPRLGAARSDQRTRLDEQRDEGAGRRQAQRVPAQGRVPRQVARLLRRSRSSPARTTRTSASVAEWNSARSWARVGKAPDRTRVEHDAADGERVVQLVAQPDPVPGRHSPAAVLRSQRRRRGELRRDRRGDRPRDDARLRRLRPAVRRARAICAIGGRRRTRRSTRPPRSSSSISSTATPSSTACRT